MPKLVNSELPYNPCGIVKPSGSWESAYFTFTSLFDYHPSRHFRINVKQEDKEKKYMVIHQTFSDLSNNGYKLFSSNYCNWKPEDEYDYDYNEDGEQCREICMTSYVMFDEENKVVVECDYSTFEIYTNQSFDYVKKNIFDKYISKYIVDSDNVKCNIIAKTDYYYLNEFDVSVSGDLDFGLYNEGFEDVHKEIVRSLTEDKNGLYILHGTAGTGKTTYIRHLIKEFGKKKKFVYVPSNLIGDMTNPSFITFIMENKESIFIIEDCESLVTTGYDGVRSSAISDMLNMTDGILADALQIKFICTFNTFESEIDQALLRPGRCRMKYNFENLTKERANEVAKRLGLKEVDSDVSLADLFNGPNEYSKKKERQKIGF